MKLLSATLCCSDKSVLDVFHAVPQLLRDCVCAWSVPRVGIQALRQVCKDLASIAPTAAQSISVLVGNGTLPGSLQMMRLFANMLLQHMDVIVVIRAGEQVLVLCCSTVSYNYLGRA